MPGKIKPIREGAGVRYAPMWIKNLHETMTKTQVLLYLNGWARRDKDLNHLESNEWRLGYSKAVRDIMNDLYKEREIPKYKTDKKKKKVSSDKYVHSEKGKAKARASNYKKDSTMEMRVLLDKCVCCRSSIKKRPPQSKYCEACAKEIHRLHYHGLNSVEAAAQVAGISIEDMKKRLIKSDNYELKELAKKFFIGYPEEWEHSVKDNEGQK